jgi:hypothetical protein
MSRTPDKREGRREDLTVSIIIPHHWIPAGNLSDTGVGGMVHWRTTAKASGSDRTQHLSPWGRRVLKCSSLSGKDTMPGYWERLRLYRKNKE